MLDAYNKYPNLVVQVGTQQRSWDHFIEAKSKIESLGPVTHVLIQHGGGYSQIKQDVTEVPPGLDWDAWQVDAPKRPFKQGYTSFRAWWEYGSGLVGDWGAHHIDVANWFMNADSKQPLKTTAVGFYSKLNGWTPEVMELPGTRYHLFRRGAQQIGGAMALSEPMRQMKVPPHWLVYFHVAKCEDSVARAQRRGGQVILAPTQVAIRAEVSPPVARRSRRELQV